MTSLPTWQSDRQLLGKSFTQWCFPCAWGSCIWPNKMWQINYFTHSIFGMTSIGNNQQLLLLLIIYREAAQRGSMKSGCCRHFCPRSKLWLWHNPGAERHMTFSSMKNTTNNIITSSQMSTAIFILYLCFDSILIYQALPNPMEFSYSKWRLQHFWVNIHHLLN